MPALWPAFITTVGGFLDAKVPKTEEDTAIFISNAYRVAVVTSTIQLAPLPFPPTTILITPDSTGIKDGILNVFNKCKQTNSIQKSHFELLANELISFWENVEWNPVPPPAGYSGPDPSGMPLIKPGINIDFLGDPSVLSSSLHSVFTPAPIPGPGGIIFATRLANAFQSHMYSLSGYYKGLTAATPPAPGPNFPWAIVT